MQGLSQTKIHMTPRTTIQSWTREQLESAFTQREWQLGEAMKTIEAQRRAISAIARKAAG